MLTSTFKFIELHKNNMYCLEDNAMQHWPVIIQDVANAKTKQQ